VRFLRTWQGSTVDFFGTIPAGPPPGVPDEGEDDVEFPAWTAPPRATLGGVAPITGTVFRDEHVFIGITSVTAYPTGAAIGVQLAVRRGDWSRERWADVESVVWGADHYPHPLGRDEREGRLRFGVELADGRRAAADRFFPRFDDDRTPPEAPVLVPNGGGGSSGGRRVDKEFDFWLWPLPEGDALDFVVAWPEVGVPVTRRTLDARAIRAAASAAEPFWP
jgi:hypothetical protein